MAFLSRLQLLVAIFLTATTVLSADLRPRDGPVLGTTCTRQDGVDHPGQDYAKYRVPTPELCAVLCSLDNRCVSAAYLVKVKDCYLKTALPKLYRSRDVISFTCKTTASPATCTPKTSTITATAMCIPKTDTVTATVTTATVSTATITTATVSTTTITNTVTVSPVPKPTCRVSRSDFRLQITTQQKNVYGIEEFGESFSPAYFTPGDGSALMIANDNLADTVGNIAFFNPDSQVVEFGTTGRAAGTGREVIFASVEDDCTLNLMAAGRTIPFQGDQFGAAALALADSDTLPPMTQVSLKIVGT